MKNTNHYDGYIDNLIIKFGDNGWIREKGKFVHRIVTWTEKEGMRLYENGELVNSYKVRKKEEL